MTLVTERLRAKGIGGVRRAEATEELQLQLALRPRDFLVSYLAEF